MQMTNKPAIARIRIGMIYLNVMIPFYGKIDEGFVVLHGSSLRHNNIFTHTHTHTDTHTHELMAHICDLLTASHNECLTLRWQRNLEAFSGSRHKLGEVGPDHLTKALHAFKAALSEIASVFGDNANGFPER